ncbi:MAG: hypothetical protein JXB29_12555 [Sedimentisphaerales bacterium]|nr:hypothetical protein [Sedimentisphaerales bacterium]
MNNSTKSKLVLSISWLFTAWMLRPTVLADSPSLPAEIEQLSEMTEQIAQAFGQQSFELCMKEEFNYGFLEHNESPGSSLRRENLKEIAVKAKEGLQKILQQQKKLKQQIENCHEQDWEQRYGQTGLFRRLGADILTTTLYKLQLEYYLALAAQQQQKNFLLEQILDEINACKSIYPSCPLDSLQAKVLVNLAQSDDDYQKRARQELDKLMTQCDTQAVRWSIAIQKMKLFGPNEPNDLNTFIDELAESGCVDIELLVSVAGLQRKYANTAGLEKIVLFWPQTEHLLGTLIISNLTNILSGEKEIERNLQQVSVFEAELAALAAWNGEPENNRLLLNRLAQLQKFQTPLILYVTAVANAKTCPDKTIQMLIRASRIWSKKDENKLGITSVQISGQAAQLAYNMVAEDNCHCPGAIRSFENYFNIAADDLDSSQEYFYTIVLAQCGQIEKGLKLLQTMANRPAGFWAKRARLDIIIRQLEQKQGKDRQEINKTLAELRNLILTCGQSDDDIELAEQATTIYCQNLLDSGQWLGAKKVLAILDEVKNCRRLPVDLYKSKALRRLGRLNESVEHMLLAVKTNDDLTFHQAMDLLSEIVDTIDRLSARVSNFEEMMENCEHLAELCHSALDTRQSALLVAELAIFTAGAPADGDNAKLSRAERILKTSATNDLEEHPDFLRCRARLLTGRGQFNQAAALWAKVRQMRSDESGQAEKGGPSRSWKWWRAKFYELYCCSGLSQNQEKQVLHSIEVLQNSFSYIPPTWNDKLGTLKEQILRNTTGS